MTLSTARDPTNILTSYLNYKPWLLQLQIRCNSLDLWPKVDSNNMEDTIPKPTNPKLPHISEYELPASIRSNRNHISTASDLTEDGIAAYKNDMDQWLLEYSGTPGHAVAFYSHEKKTSHVKHSKADAARWHKRMGHPGPAALEHLVQRSEGVKIKDITTVQCDAYGRAKLKRQIRRTPRNSTEGPGGRIALYFHSYEDGSCTKEKSQIIALGLQFNNEQLVNRTSPPTPVAAAMRYLCRT